MRELRLQMSTGAGDFNDQNPTSAPRGQTDRVFLRTYTGISLPSNNNIILSVYVSLYD